MALTFTQATEDKVTLLADVATDDLTNETITAWIYLDSADAVMICAKRGAGRENFALSSGATRLWYYIVCETAAGSWASPADSITIGAWYHVAVTCNRGATPPATPVFYINGTLVATTVGQVPEGTAVSNAGDPFGLGYIPGSTYCLDGAIEDLRVYNRILSAKEIATIYACRGVDGIVYGLIHRFMLNELPPGSTATGTVVIDSSGTQKVTVAGGTPVYREGPTRGIQ